MDAANALNEMDLILGNKFAKGDLRRKRRSSTGSFSDASSAVKRYLLDNDGVGAINQQSRHRTFWNEIQLDSIMAQKTADFASLMTPISEDKEVRGSQRVVIRGSY